MSAGARQRRRRTDRAGDPDRRVRGNVRWFSQEKGYGFIAPRDGGDDVFVRQAAIEGDGFRSLHPDQEVSFVRERDGRGPRATDVRPARG